MNKRVGLWIDHSKAILISITEDGEERSIVTSAMEHYLNYSSTKPRGELPEDVHDKRYWDHLDKYYDKVLVHLQDSEAVQIFGPGEAKYELKKRLQDVGFSEYSITVENTDKLTDHQIAKKVRARFPIRSQYDIF